MGDRTRGVGLVSSSLGFLRLDLVSLSGLDLSPFLALSRRLIGGPGRDAFSSLAFWWEEAAAFCVTTTRHVLSTLVDVRPLAAWVGR